MKENQNENKYIKTLFKRDQGLRRKDGKVDKGLRDNFEILYCPLKKPFFKEKRERGCAH